MATQERNQSFSPLRRALFELAVSYPVATASARAEGVAVNTAAGIIHIARIISDFRKAFEESQQALEPVNRLMNPPGIDESLSCVSGNTTYEPSTLGLNRIITFGDSIARGEQEQAKPYNIADLSCKVQTVQDLNGGGRMRPGMVQQPNKHYCKLKKQICAYLKAPHLKLSEQILF